MAEAMNNSKLLELAPLELIIPLKVSYAGRPYRVRHVLRPPAPPDWFAYEAALELAVEELPPADDSDEPTFRLHVRSADAALLLWNRLIRRVEGYALSSEYDFSERCKGPESFGEGRAERETVPTDEGSASRVAPALSVAEGSIPASRVGGASELKYVPPPAQPAGVQGSLRAEPPLEGTAQRSAPLKSCPSGIPPTGSLDATGHDAWEHSGHSFSELSGNPVPVPRSRTAGLGTLRDRRSAEGSRAQVGGILELGEDWRELIPLAHKEAAVRALTLVAPAALPYPTNNDSTSNYFPLHADEIPVVVEAVVCGVAYPRLVHRFRPPSVEAERAYRRLLAETLIVRGSRSPRTLIPARLPALVRLYDQLILGVEGYSISLQPPASRDQVVQSMDAWHKRIALQTLFGDLSADLPTEVPPSGTQAEASAHGDLTADPPADGTGGHDSCPERSRRISRAEEVAPPPLAGSASRVAPALSVAEGSIPAGGVGGTAAMPVGPSASDGPTPSAIENEQ